MDFTESPSVSLRGVTKRYHVGGTTVTALEAVDLDVYPGASFSDVSAAARA